MTEPILLGVLEQAMLPLLRMSQTGRFGNSENIVVKAHGLH
jgi:hypothetical protein